jgi:hypothetical protein
MSRVVRQARDLWIAAAAVIVISLAVPSAGADDAGPAAARADAGLRSTRAIETGAAAVSPSPRLVWEAVGPGATSDPVAVSDATRQVVDGFVRTGSSLLHRRYTVMPSSGSDGWLAPLTENLGGVLGSGPAAVATTAGTYVFAVGADDAVWYRLIDNNGTVTPWTTVGGVARRKPVVVFDSSGVVELFAVGTDDAVWTRRLSLGVWSPWETLGGIVTSDLAAEGPGTGMPGVEVVARGTDDAIWAITEVSGVWQPWVSLGGAASGAPALAYRQVTARGMDGQLWLHDGGWVPTAGYAASDPTMTLVYYGTSIFAVLAQGLDGAAWERVWGQGSTQWFSLGGVATSTIAAAPLDVGSCFCGIRIYAVGTNGALYTTWN